MKLNKTKPNCLVMMILALHIRSEAEASSHNDNLRILIVGDKHHVRYSADVLLGQKESRQMMKSEVITDQGRRMMAVTGPNPCENHTETQTFKTAQFLSSPGPHAVLMVLNLEDQEFEKCDIPRQLQDLLGSEVLQYCIVLLLQQDPEKADSITGTLRGRAGEIINSCGGRFHIVTDTDPKPAQTTALIAEIRTLVWMNGGTFYSALIDTQQIETNELLKTLQDKEERLKAADQDADEETLLLVIYQALGGTAGAVGLGLLVSVVVFTKGRHELCHFAAISCVLVVFMIILRNVLSPNVAVPVNLVLSTTFTITITHYDLSHSRHGHQILLFLIMIFNLPSIVFIAGLGLTLGTFTSIRAWSDVLTASHTAPGVTFGAHVCKSIFMTPEHTHARTTLLYTLKLLLCCMVGAILSMGLVTVFTLFDMKITIILLILGLTMACFYFKSELVQLVVVFLFFPWCCVLIGSVTLLLW